MRKRIIHQVLISLLSLSTIINGAEPSIDEILRTDQYLLVAQQDNYRFMETNVTHGRCAQVFLQPESEGIQYRYVSIHLIRDTNGVFPPKLLVVKEDRSFYHISIVPLNSSNIFNKTEGKTLESVDKKTSLWSISGIRGKSSRTLSYSLFDSTKHMLFLDFSTPETYDIEQHYFPQIFNEDPEYVKVKRYTHTTSIRRYGWVEDPYTNMFYYKEGTVNGEVLFEAHLTDAIDILSRKKSGRRSDVLLMGGEIRGVSNGAFYVTKSENVNGTLALRSSLTSTSSNLSVNCIAENLKLPGYQNLIIIQKYDYCLLRYGSYSSKERCDKDQLEYLYSKNYIEGEGINFLRYLLIFCIIMTVIVILLCLYIYWLRSSFVSPDDITHHNENETEASLFIAKQRSFPASFQDPAVLDISVDKWN